jgi:prophage DNA circulation protein
MTDVMLSMRRASWREIEFPITATREFSFSHEQERHRYIFRDQQLVESLGRDNPIYSYQIPFREDIAKGPWANLFTEVYPLFLAACLDRSAGVLEDPIHGSIRAKCVSLRESLDVAKRDGVDVFAEFILAPTVEDILQDLGANIATIEGAKGVAGLFDREASKLDDATRQAILDRQSGAPETTLDIFDAISSIGNRTEAAANKIVAQMHDTAFRMEKTADTIDRLKNPKLAPLRQAAKRLQFASIRLADEATTPPRPTEVVKLAQDITLIALAGLYGIAVRDFIRLNPMLARSPIVRAGTFVKRYAE